MASSHLVYKARIKLTDIGHTKMNLASANAPGGDGGRTPKKSSPSPLNEEKMKKLLKKQKALGQEIERLQLDLAQLSITGAGTGAGPINQGDRSRHMTSSTQDCWYKNQKGVLALGILITPNNIRLTGRFEDIHIGIGISMPSTRRGVFQKNPEENESAVTPRTQRNHMSTPEIIPHPIPSLLLIYRIKYMRSDIISPNNKGKNSKPKPSLTARPPIPVRKKNQPQYRREGGTSFLKPTPSLRPSKPSQIISPSETIQLQGRKKPGPTLRNK
ncbi:hypothetical protein Daesc_001698 [Daldinia eschscholtzii]|uniref:Uncharacterized protein n=1 Tax=Daldinia eschscholtzii TaxID=292717 RepID=A0AAX6MW45_9PEZI